MMIESLFTSLPMVACLLCATLIGIKLLRNHGIDDAPSRWLLVWLLTTTALYWGHWIFFNHAMDAVPAATAVYSAANVAVYPMFLLYVVSLTSPGNRVDRRWWLTLLPAVAMLAVMGGLMAAMGGERAAAFAGSYPYDNNLAATHGLERAAAIAILCGKAVFPLTVIGVVVTAYRRMHDFERCVENFYSNSEGRNVRPLRQLTIAMAVIAVASIAAGLLGRAAFADTHWPLYAVSLVFTVLLLAITNEGYTLAPDLGRDDIADAVPETVATPVADDADTAAVEAARDELWREVERLMDTGRLYLRPDLKIADVAARLGSNRHYVYEAIKLGTGGLTFSDLVNRLRVNHAVTLLEAHPDLSIAEVAEQSGYNSITSFYRNFKRHMGCLPGDLPKPPNTDNKDN